jgi:hypothetical protein
MVYTIKRIWEQQLAAATYSDSVVDCVIEDCLRADQQTREDLRTWHVFFRAIPQPVKLALEKPTRSSEEVEYQIPNHKFGCLFEIPELSLNYCPM